MIVSFALIFFGVGCLVRLVKRHREYVAQLYAAKDERPVSDRRLREMHIIDRDFWKGT